MSRRDHRRNEILVKRALFIEAGKHHPQFMRPYGINASEENIETMLDQLNNSDFNPDTVGGWGGEIIYSDAQVDDEDEALIPHGWDSNRLRMYLHVEMKDRTFKDTWKEYFITGFTENDTTFEVDDENIDMEPDTRVFINSIVRISIEKSDNVIRDLIGSGTSDDRYRIESNAHNLTAYTDDDVRGRDRDSFYTIRPYDIAAKLDHETSNIETDSRSDFTSQSYKASTRTNMVATHYLGRTVNELVEGAREIDRSDRWRNSTTGTRYTKAQSALSENSLSKCPLTTELKNVTDLRRTGYITWEEAQKAFKGLGDSRYTQIMYSDAVEKEESRTSDLDGEKWHQSDMETQQSYQAMNAISGLMAECCIISAHIIATCEYQNAPIEITFARGTAPVFFIEDMTEDQQEDMIDSLIYRLKHFVFEPLAYTVGFFDLEANMDVLGDSEFTLSIQGEADATFWAPTFADGSTGGMVTSRKSASLNIGEDIQRLADALFIKH